MKTKILKFKILQWMHRKLPAIQQNHQNFNFFSRDYRYPFKDANAYIFPIKAHMKCIVDQSDYSGEEDAPQTSYYQWVTFFFAIQVVL
jgi:hypothetical protein